MPNHRNRSRSRAPSRYTPLAGGVPLAGKGFGTGGGRAGPPHRGGSPPRHSPPPSYAGWGRARPSGWRPATSRRPTAPLGTGRPRRRSARPAPSPMPRPATAGAAHLPWAGAAGTASPRRPLGPTCAPVTPRRTPSLLGCPPGPPPRTRRPSPVPTRTPPTPGVPAGPGQRSAGPGRGAHTALRQGRLRGGPVRPRSRPGTPGTAGTGPWSLCST